MATKKKSGGKRAAAAKDGSRASRYPFATVRVNGVKCRATDYKPADDALAEMKAAKKK